MRAFIFLLLAFTLTGSPALAATAVELRILQEFFAPAGVENRSLHLTVAAQEEFSRRAMVGVYLPKDATVSFRLLVESENTAIYEAVVDRADTAEMWSAFFQRGPFGSKLDTIKSLHIPPYLASVEYQRLRTQSGRSAVQEMRLVQLQRLYMTTEMFKEFFKQNQPTFEAIARLVETGKMEEAEAAAKAAALVGARLYGASKSDGEMTLLVSAAGSQGAEKGSGLGSEVRVSAFLDSVFGLLHLPPGVNPPPMSPQDYIFVEALGENWYLFRNIAAEPLKEKAADE
ncbi:MAG: hypothetical protein Q7U44_02700 [Desulfuromonadales bacterium]|nr:hypothetical protein [Desulfuromonadales bacterium]